MRDALAAMGVIVETFETAITWDRFEAFHGAIMSVAVGEREVHAHVPREADLPGEGPVWLAFRRYHVFDRESGERLRSEPKSP